MTEVTMYETTVALKEEAPLESELKPLPFRLSLLLFGVPALLMIASLFVGIPLLDNLGLEPIVSFLTAFTIPMAWMFAAALIAYHKVEGRPLQWAAFAARMRLPRFALKDLLWGILVFVLGMVGVVLLTPLSLRLIDAGWLPVPGNLPLLLDPHAVISEAALDQTAGGALQGRWDILLLFIVYIFFNIAGEELWWRGTILPRQELRHGRWTWVVHGLLWAAFHAFKWWSIITVLPLTLAIAFISQRRKSTWPAVIAHLLGNVSFFSFVAAGVLDLF